MTVGTALPETAITELDVETTVPVHVNGMAVLNKATPKTERRAFYKAVVA